MGKFRKFNTPLPCKEGATTAFNIDIDKNIEKLLPIKDFLPFHIMMANLSLIKRSGSLVYLVTFWLTDKSSISNLFLAGTTASRFGNPAIYNHFSLKQLCKSDM